MILREDILILQEILMNLREVHTILREVLMTLQEVLLTHRAEIVNFLQVVLMTVPIVWTQDIYNTIMQKDVNP